MALVFASDQWGPSVYNLCAGVDVRDELDLFSRRNHALFINLPGLDRCSRVHLQQRHVGISTGNSLVFCHLLLMKLPDNKFNDVREWKTKDFQLREYCRVSRRLVLQTSNRYHGDLERPRGHAPPTLTGDKAGKVLWSGVGGAALASTGI